MTHNKLSVALRNLEAARKALEGERKRLVKQHGKVREVDRLLDNVDATEIQLLSLRESVRLAERQQRYTTKKRHPDRAIKETKKRRQKAPKGQKAKRPQVIETWSAFDRIIGTRELSIRGFWDRYPKEEQKKYPKRFSQFPSKLRRGPTAYDLLLRDYLSFTPEQRRHLQLRVAYGVVHETGEIITGDMVDIQGLHINLSTNLNEASLAFRAVLARAGLVYVPIGWEDLDEDSSVPLGIEWWVVND